MKQLLIAEKPSVAKDIARVLAVSKRFDGYFESEKWVISWCIGHLVELVEPDSYNSDWKKWSMHTLPIIPSTFRYRVVDSTRKQYNVLSSLFSRKDIDCVINACDAGREGELIFRLIYEMNKSDITVKRLWISSLTDQAIKDGLNNLKHSSNFDRLYYAAKCRAQADWLVGINATRGITVKAGQGKSFGKSELYSVGRVQTPTLALIVERDKEINSFSSKIYWQVFVEFKHENGLYTGKWFKLDLDKETKKEITIDTFDSEINAKTLCKRIENKNGFIHEIESKIIKEFPPQLFDLTSLQRTANKRYGFSASKTLEIAQSLYEKHKMITYPRTDSSYISNDMIQKIPIILNSFDEKPYSDFAKEILSWSELPINKRFVDDKKVTDHHAIIPTSSKSRIDYISSDELKIYDMIARRFLSAFYPEATYEQTKIVTAIPIENIALDGLHNKVELAEKEFFVSRGKVLLTAGWKIVSGFLEKDERNDKKSKTKNIKNNTQQIDDHDDRNLPKVSLNDIANNLAVKSVEKETNPPQHYTEATLLAAMEGISKRLDDDDMQIAMKDRGLGTPATRAGIIETLIQRKYIQRSGKNLISTDKGSNLITVIPIENLKNPALTGEWEAKLAKISRGEHLADNFMQEVDNYLSEVILRLKQANMNFAVFQNEDNVVKANSSKTKQKEIFGDKLAKNNKQKIDNIDNKENSNYCPICKNIVLAKDEGFICSSTECVLKIPKIIYGKKITEKTMLNLLKSSKSSILKGFKYADSDSLFSARIVLKKDGTLVLENDVDKSAISIPKILYYDKSNKNIKPEKNLELFSGKHLFSIKKATQIDTFHGKNTDISNIAKIDGINENKAEKSKILCPLCRKGYLITGKKGWGCSNWRLGCYFVVPFQIDEYNLPSRILLEFKQNYFQENYQDIYLIVDYLPYELHITLDKENSKTYCRFKKLKSM